MDADVKRPELDSWSLSNFINISQSQFSHLQMEIISTLCPASENEKGVPIKLSTQCRHLVITNNASFLLSDSVTK